MDTRTFNLRRILIFPDSHQKLLLEKLFFITRYITNKYNNVYRSRVYGYGRPNPMTYQELEERLISDIDALGGAPPGTLGQAIYLHPKVLKPCLREIEQCQQKYATNANFKLGFVYPGDIQSFWINNIEIKEGRLTIPGEPDLNFEIKNKESLKCGLVKVIKTREGTYELQLLEETYGEAHQDNVVRHLTSQLDYFERKVQEEITRTSFMRSRSRRIEDTEPRAFMHKRAIFKRLFYLLTNISEPVDEEEVPCLS